MINIHTMESAEIFANLYPCYSGTNVIDRYSSQSVNTFLRNYTIFGQPPNRLIE